MTDANDDAVKLLDAWRNGASAHVRLDRLLRVLEPADALDLETLGQRNQRLLRLAGRFGSGRLEGVATCSACTTDNEFTIPVDELLAIPPPSATSTMVAGMTLRLPRMVDLLADDPTPLLARCTDGALSVEAAQAAGTALDALDPAASVVLEITCAHCSLGFLADVDIAGFVEVVVDRVATVLLRDIDVIASAYGWSEYAIAALPSQRRRAYVAMIRQRHAPPSEAIA
jgi:hypothetical protein